MKNLHTFLTLAIKLLHRMAVLAGTIEDPRPRDEVAYELGVQANRYGMRCPYGYWTFERKCWNEGFDELTSIAVRSW